MFRSPHAMRGRGVAKLDATLQLGMHVAGASTNDIIAAPPGLEGSPFVADRARFLARADPKEHCFDPVPHLP